MRKSMWFVLGLSSLALATPSWASWTYRAEKEPTSGRDYLLASTRSTHKVDMGVNYRMVEGVLTLRRHAKFGSEVLFSVTAGQIVCRSYAPCQVIVRFDEQPAQVYTAVGAAGTNATTIYIQNFDRFVGALRGAKRVSIEAEFYQRGKKAFDFEVAGLDAGKIQWSSPAPTKAKAEPAPATARQALPVSAAERSPVALAKEKKCLGCHEIGFKLVGPAYREVAEKYRGVEGSAARLAAKVVAGGSGVWGETAMPPNDISAEDARFLVEWVLSQ